jgi:hypothetical protein
MPMPSGSGLEGWEQVAGFRNSHAGFSRIVTAESFPGPVDSPGRGAIPVPQWVRSSTKVRAL